MYIIFATLENIKTKFNEYELVHSLPMHFASLILYVNS